MANYRDDFSVYSTLLPHQIDHFAKTKPDAVYAEYPLSPTSYDLGFRLITFRDLANTVNGIAWWLARILGLGNGEVLAYIGPNDLRYPTLVLGAIKAGYVMFLTSPRNSTAAHESLFKRLNCTKILAPILHPTPIESILSTCKAQLCNVPSVEELVGTRHRHFELSKTYPEAAEEPLLIVHTSGSTGIPKPIIWTHEFVVKNMHLGNLEPPPGFENMGQWTKGKRVFLAPPPFHAAGLIYLLYLGVPTDTVIVCPTASSPPTAAGLVEAMKLTPINAAFVIPSIVHELAHDPELLEYCSRHLDLITYAGGDLPQAIGDTVASKLLLVNKYGASELGVLNAIYSPTYRDPQRDWRYLHFHPELGAEFRQVTEDEYELVLVRTKETETHLPPFTLFPELIEYQTRDLFVRHPDKQKANLWRYSARDDDVVVFLNGEKTNPISMEQHILASNPGVMGVLVSGAKRVQASLLVEIAGEVLSPAGRALVMQRIWPSIEEANSLSPGHARIDKAHILFTTVDKPMLRTSKGTIQRAGTLALPGGGDDVSLVTEYIRNVLISVTGWDEDRMRNQDNFFHLGFDSLHTIAAARQLKYGPDILDITPDMIYQNPSVSELADAVTQYQYNQGTQEASDEKQLQERSALLQEFLRHIHSDKTGSEITGNDTQEHTVTLTGSTGTLGTYILDTLLQDPSVAHVYCLNRSHDSKNVQLQKTNQFSLSTSLSSSRVSFHTADLSQPDLALPRETLITIRRTTTHIIHNAWLLRYESPHPHLRGKHHTRRDTDNHFHFFHRLWNSKYLAEHIINHAVKTQHLRASVARVGQIAAAVNGPGAWKREEWFPSLVRSSLWLGALPSSLGPVLDRVDWVPVDLLAAVLVELALVSTQPVIPEVGTDAGVEVLHPHNTFPTAWDVLAPTIASILASYSGRPMETIPLTEWIERVRRDLERSSDDGSDGSGDSNASRSRRNSSSQGSVVSGGEESLHTTLEENPAVKLLGFFESLVVDDANDIRVFETSRAVKRSKKLRNVPSVSEEWVKKWVPEMLDDEISRSTSTTKSYWDSNG
ncbi:NRPS-like enzyme [Aspergillus germanicus]